MNFSQNLKTAEKEDVLAQFKLGDCYFYGKGVNVNFAKAAYWYQKTTEQGEKILSLVSAII